MNDNKACLDFGGNELHKGNCVIRAVHRGSSGDRLEWGVIETEPVSNGQGWSFRLRSYCDYDKSFKRPGYGTKARAMLRVDWVDVPKEICRAYLDTKND